MADDVLELADKLWRGDIDIVEIHPVGGYMGGVAEVADGVSFVPSFANVSAIATGDGLVLVDTGSSFVAEAVHEALRGWSGLRLNTAIYSHGHIDHVFGVGVWEEESSAQGLAGSGGRGPRRRAGALRPLHRDRRLQRDHQPTAVRRARVPVAHRVPLPRPHLRRSTSRWRWAASTSSCTMPGARPTTTPGHGSPRPRVLCCGDLFIWASPNAGNPQKVQRYPREWAVAPARDGRASSPRSCSRGTASPSWGRRASARRSPTPPISSTPSSTRPSSS